MAKDSVCGIEMDEKKVPAKSHHKFHSPSQNA